MDKPRQVTAWRDARTGRFVSKIYADENPATTVRERIYRWVGRLLGRAG